MKDLVEFLRARLDEDERSAHRMQHFSVDGGGYFSCRKRELVEVEATRGIVEWCVEVIGDRDLSRYGQFGFLRNDTQALAVTLAVETLRLLISPYADHPDYNPAWAPERCLTWTTRTGTRRGC